MNLIKDMVAKGLQHISTTKHVIIPDVLVSDTPQSLKTRTINRYMLTVLEYFDHLLVTPHHLV